MILTQVQLKYPWLLYKHRCMPSSDVGKDILLAPQSSFELEQPRLYSICLGSCRLREGNLHATLRKDNREDDDVV